MFTGLVQAVGRVTSLSQAAGDFRLAIDGALPGEPLALGESIAVNGACLTVVAAAAGAFAAQASAETLRRTNLGALEAGTEVNLERALRLCDRLGGHLVLGHVDGVGALLRTEREGNAVHVHVQAPEALRVLVVDKGSIAVDGISLTVNGLDADGVFVVTVVPYTAGEVALLRRPRGWRCNLEVDILGKYVAHLLRAGLPLGAEAMMAPAGGGSAVTLDLLRRSGFVSGDVGDE